MPGLRQPLSAHIQQIRNDLRERYKGGFPILKELLQNADDAGGGTPGASASEMVLLLAPGIPNSRHVLLQTPGLCLLNDGDFTASDAISISSYGSSNRGSQSATVGRFGLGLKSVFHWAEAFFYFSPARFAEPADGCPPSDLLHPWISRETGLGFHKDWDQQWEETQKHDHAQFETIARALLKSERWFGLWIPFRVKSLLNGVEPVLPEWPLGTDGQEASYESLFGIDWERRVSEVLPLLRRLRHIRFCSRRAAGVEECLALSVEDPSRRMSFLAGNGHEFQPGPAGLEGKVSVRKAAGVAEAVSFAGIEKVPGTVDAAQWQDHRFWPRPFVQTENGGEEPRPEKAAEHGAVAFMRQRATEGEVRIQPAVFLPLGEPETRSVKGGVSYAIFLHGHFFVDSGRRDIERFDGMAADTTFETVSSEEDLRKLWNRALMRDVVAPLVLPSLDAFVRQERMEAGDVETLVEAMEKSKTLKLLTPWMCRGQRFILRLLPAGSAWERQTWDDEPARWLALPASDFAEVGLFSLMPALADLSRQVAVSLEGKPRLADHKQKPALPSDEELAKLLGSVPVSAFSDPQQLAYLLKLIPQDASERKPDSLLTVALVLLANQLIGHPLPDDEGLAKLWKQFFKQIAATVFVGLPAKSTEANPEISRVLANSKLPVALLWQDFRDAEGNGSIDWLTLLPALRGIGGLAFKAEEVINQRSRIAVRLLETSTGKPADWTGQIRHIALFAAREPDKTGCAVSFGDLETANADGRLFSGSEPFAKDLAKAAPELKPLLVQLAVARVLNLQAPDCDAAACVRLVRSVDRLAADFSSRKPLFERLLQAARSDDADFWSALRCLLHGDINARESRVTLFDETAAAPALLRLLEMALTAANQAWRRIAASVAGQLGLTAQRRQHLNLVPASEANVEALVKDVGPANLDCSDLSTADCDFILERFSDIDVLRGLNIHETVDGRRVGIAPHTYVHDQQFAGLPAEFDELVTRVRPRNGYHRFDNPDGSNWLVNILSWDAVIEIALSQSSPDRWASTILTAIGQRGNLRADLRERVRTVVWLPLTTGLPVKPADLMHVPGAEVELDKLPAEILSDRVPLGRLHKDVLNHDAFDTFKKTILPCIQEALDALAGLLQRDAAWATGLSGEWTAEQVGDWVCAFDGVSPKALPVAALVRTLHTAKDVRDLLPGFLQRIGGKLSAKAYANALKHMADEHRDKDADSRRPIGRVFLRYLRFVNAEGAEFARRVLSGEQVCLLSAAGAWLPPSQLAFACNGLPTQSCLCDEQAEALPALRPPENVLVAEPEETPGHARRDFDFLLRETPQVLRRYFSTWRDEVPPECIGAFLTVLGDDEVMVRLAREFLGNRSLDGVRQEIDAYSTPQIGQPLRVQAGQYRFACVAHGSRRVKLLSILGTRFSANLAGQVQTLFLGDGLEVYQGDGNWYRRTLHLAPIPADQFTSDQLSEILLNSTTEILYNVYCLREIRLGPLWKRLSHSAQLHIRIAQNRVVDAAQAFLRQVGAHRTPEVEVVLREWDAADRRRAEAEEAGRGVPHEVQQQLLGAKSRLRELLKGHAQTQQATLTAVRHKIGRDYGYEPVSVPFEMWQNADDALVELGALGHDCNRAEKLGFVVELGHGGVRFAHWGRLVNEFQGADGRQFRNRGFDEDLEKMVVQAISDKRAGEQQGEAVTGKFGLGFKSVFLVTDSPEVVSGNVDFAIRGGIYPLRLGDGQRAALETSLRALAPDYWRRGTIIQLPLRSDMPVNQDEVLRIFRRLAPMLVVFSRRLKRLRFRAADNQETEVRWEPASVADIEGMECGVMSALENSPVHLALALSRAVGNDRVQFLLGMGADGFVPLPDDVPVFWVTAPTRAMTGYGFAVNGPFEPDVGRAQLAPQSKRNRQLAGELAAALTNRLTALHAKAVANWDVLRGVLQLASGTTADNFWESLWEVLGRRLAGKCRKDDGSPLAALARRILWESPADGLPAFYRQCNALPTGLWGDYGALTKLPVLRFVASGALDREDVFKAVSQWSAFRKRVSPGAISSHRQVASTLTSFGVTIEAAELVKLTDAVGWELSERRLADSELATRLGELIRPDFIKKLREGIPGERDEQEQKALSELLSEVQFQAADASWHKPTELVVDERDEVEADERLRAAFAPQECRLNPAYTGPGLAFFLACRPRLEAGVELMAEWILLATSEPTRVAALKYLLKGELREHLAEELRRQRDDNKWLWQLKSGLFDWFKDKFPDEAERFEILAYRLRLFEEQLRQAAESEEQEEQQEEQAPEVVQPWTVAELWKWWQEQGEPTGDYTLEGEANWELFHGGDLWGQEERKAELQRLLLSPDDPAGKALWYRLFGYACLVSAGRTMTELREFWKYQLNPRQFWERTSEGDFSERTQEIFEQAVTAKFTDMAAGGERAYFWRRVFYDIRKVHRMVQNEFPAVLLDLVHQGHGEHLRQFLRTGHLPGPDQPRWIGTFGQSADTPLGFIIRELMRVEVIVDEAVRPYAFYVCRPVLRALVKIGWIPNEDCGFSGEEWLAELAKDPIHGPLLKPFYDIPLLHMGITHRGDRMPRRPEQGS